MSTLGKRIEEKRIAKGLKKKDLAKLINVHDTLIGKYERDEVDLGASKIKEIAKFLNTTPTYLMGWEDNDKEAPQGIKIPVLGTVAAGIPISAVEDILDYEEIPQSWENQGEFFGLRIKGDSMQPKMDDGDVVIVRQQSDANSGDTVIALVNGDDATCKKLQKTENGIMLVSTNPNYLPMFFTNEEIVTKPVVILGKVVELRSKF